jgi:NTP pyrophosphatase (non-canonical NTP hydrolase)
MSGISIYRWQVHVYEFAKQARDAGTPLDTSEVLDKMALRICDLREAIDTQEQRDATRALADIFLKLVLVAQILNVDLEKEVARVWEGRK